MVPTPGRLRPEPGQGIAPGKFLENLNAKSCILVTTCCEISCFLKTTARKLGDQYIVGPNLKVVRPVSHGPYGCCIYCPMPLGQLVENRRIKCVASSDHLLARLTRGRSPSTISCVTLFTSRSYFILIMPVYPKRPLFYQNFYLFSNIHADTLLVFSCGISYRTPNVMYSLFLYTPCLLSKQHREDVKGTDCRLVH